MPAERGKPMKTANKPPPVSFRPDGPLVARVELMQQLRVNQSEVFNAILAANLKMIDAAIAKRREQLEVLLARTVR